MVSTAVRLFISVLSILVLARILTSWFRPRYRTRENGWFFTLDEWIWRATEPLLAPIRNLLPMGSIGIDFSPWILMILVQMLGGYLISFLERMGL